MGLLKAIAIGGLSILVLSPQAFAYPQSKRGGALKKSTPLDAIHHIDESHEKVYFEYGLATVSAGFEYNNGKGRTLLRKYYVAAVGPTALTPMLHGIFTDAAKTACISGVKAASAVPDATGAARLAAGITAFKASLYASLSLKGVATEIIRKFHFGLSDRNVWVNGLELRFKAETSSARLYAMFHEEIAHRLPGGIARDVVNSIAVFYTKLADVSETEIRIEIREPEKLAQIVWPGPVVGKAAEEFFQNAAREAQKVGAKLASVVPHVLRMGSEAVNKVAGGVQDVARVISELPAKTAEGLGDNVRNLQRAADEERRRLEAELAEADRKRKEVQKRLGIPEIRIF